MIEMMMASEGDVKPSEPKYLDFLAYMSRLNLITEDLSTAIQSKYNPDRGGHRRAVDMSKGVEGNMQGSPWQQGTPTGANIGRIIRHLCPSEEMFLRLKSEGRMVMLQPSFSSSAQVSVSLSGMSRNGYTSSSTSVSKGVSYVSFGANPSLVYYDSEADELYSMFGSGKSGPTLWQIPA